MWRRIVGNDTCYFGTYWNGFDKRLCVSASIFTHNDRRFRHKLFVAEVRRSHAVWATFVSWRSETNKILLLLVDLYEKICLKRIEDIQHLNIVWWLNEPSLRLSVTPRPQSRFPENIVPRLFEAQVGRVENRFDRFLHDRVHVWLVRGRSTRSKATQVDSTKEEKGIVKLWTQNQILKLLLLHLIAYALLQGGINQISWRARF